MVQRITEELYFDDGSRRFHFNPAVKNGCVVEAGKHFSFELCRKRAVFGEVPVDQFWMELPSVYARAGRRARNFDVLVEFFWSRCKEALTVFDDEVVDSYILAKLLPHVRRNGSRRVFDDAILTREHRFSESKGRLIDHLEGQLASVRHETLDMAEFHRRTADLLGPPEFEPEVLMAYRQMADELLGEGRRAVQRWGMPGLKVPIKRFETWMKTIARHRGHDVQKAALDIVSYECRAAMHRCYSATWEKLLLHLEKKYALDEASVQFHRLMHFDLVFPSDHPGAYFHLFHGHVFCLHPGAALFLQTKTGGELVGDYLGGGDGDQPFRRFLNGLWVGLVDYYLRSERYAEARKKSPGEVWDGDPELTSAIQTGGRGRRCLPGPKKE